MSLFLLFTCLLETRRTCFTVCLLSCVFYLSAGLHTHLYHCHFIYSTYLHLFLFVSLPLYHNDVIFNVMSFILGVALNELNSGKDFIISPLQQLFI